MKRNKRTVIATPKPLTTTTKYVIFFHQAFLQSRWYYIITNSRIKTQKKRLPTKLLGNSRSSTDSL